MKIYLVIQHTEQYDSESELMPTLEIEKVFNSFEGAKEYIEVNYKQLKPTRLNNKSSLGGKVLIDYADFEKDKFGLIGLTIEEHEVI